MSNAQYILSWYCTEDAPVLVQRNKKKGIKKAYFEWQAREVRKYVELTEGEAEFFKSLLHMANGPCAKLMGKNVHNVQLEIGSRPSEYVSTSSYVRTEDA